MSSTRMSWKVLLAACSVLLLGLAAYNYLACYCRTPIHMTLSGGNVCPLRSEMAERICDEVREEGIELESVCETSSDSISKNVDAQRVDLGLVLGGFPPGMHPNVRQVATLGVEPLHLLVRPELLKGGSWSLERLRGRRISLGERGTNGVRLATELLRFAGLKPTTAKDAGDFEPVYWRETELIAQLQTWSKTAPPIRAVLAERLPDAFFVVDGLPAPLVDELVKTAGYQLVPLPYATALHLNSRRDATRQDRDIEYSRLEEISIPAYTYSIDPAVPPADCPTFGLRLLLVAHKDVPSHAVLHLLRALDDGAAERYHVDLDVTDELSDFPVHPGAQAFADERRPAAVNELLEPLTNFLSVLGAGAAGGFALWGFLRGLRAVNPDIHLRQIDRIERLLQGSELDELAPKLPLEFVDFLEARLAHIKQTAIEDFAQGRLEGDQALVSILTLVADTRHLLVQRRKQLGQEASAKSRPGRLSDAA